MGSSKGSSTTTVQPTQEQKDLLRAQTNFLTGTAFPAYQQTIGGAQNALNQTSPAATQAAQTAMDVSGRAGALQEAGGTRAYQTGLGGTQNLANYQTGLGQALTGQGVGGVGSLANYQGGMGANLMNTGASQLSQLFSPQYQQQQIQAALQPASEQERELMNQQSSLYGGAGGLGSSRQALASQNLASLGQARLGNIAAQTAANIAGQRQQAANTLLGTGQSAMGQAAGLYGQLLGAGQGATSAAQSAFGNLANLGQQGLTGAQQSAASRIGYAGTPQDIFSKYASVVYGVPQGNTTPSFQGTQGSSTSGKSSGFRL
jgi:hypothetical protein